MSVFILLMSAYSLTLQNLIIERASGFWAAKALVKAIGCGFRDGVRFQDIEIKHDAAKAPYFVISGTKKFLSSGVFKITP